MLKRLAIAAFCLAFLFADCPDESRAQQKKQGQSVPTPTGTIVDNSERQNATNRPSEGAPWSHTGIEWSNWVIAGVGLLTCWAVWRQARESAKATKAMRDSIALQQGQLGQWVNTTDNNWEVQSSNRSPYATETVITISLGVINPTKMPLTLKAIKSIAGQEAEERPLTHVLLPKEVYVLTISKPLNGQEFLQCKSNRLNLEFSLTVDFIDNFGKAVTQTLDYTCICSFSAVRGIELRKTAITTCARS